MTEHELVEACREGNRRAQKLLYERYAPEMFGVCKRYLKREEDAEDVLIEAFYKVFNHLTSFKGEGSFEGWIRRIVVNEALMHLRKRHNFHITVELEDVQLAEPFTTHEALAAKDILKLLDGLPTGYRTVFNLYVMEGYKHREIADILSISINTSKSQLILAKKRLQDELERLQYPDVG